MTIRIYTEDRPYAVSYSGVKIFETGDFYITKGTAGYAGSTWPAYKINMRKFDIEILVTGEKLESLDSIFEDFHETLDHGSTSYELFNFSIRAFAVYLAKNPPAFLTWAQDYHNSAFNKGKEALQKTIRQVLGV